MKIISYADKNFAHYIPKLQYACDELGYDLVHYNESDVSHELCELALKGVKPTNHLSKSPQKPDVIKKAMDKYDESLIWIDSDAFPIKRLDIDWDFDVAFTLRPENERGGVSWRVWDGLINAGVNFYNNTPESKKFLDEVIKEVPLTQVKSDQEAINVCLLRRGWNEQYGDFTLKGLRVRVLRTEEWNCYHFPHPPEARILHFKNPFKELYNKNYEIHYPNYTA